MPGAISAVLFDIDGTLVDSNYLHVDAWSQALVDVGRPAETWRIHSVIGMDSGKLLEALLGDDAERLGEQAKDRHKHYYERSADRLRAFAHAQDLLRALAERGLKVVLATSAPSNEFAILTDVLDVGDAVTESTTAEDVGTAKPAPDVVQVALRKAGVQADQAVMVGDAVWDVEACVRAGVRVIGLRSGGVGGAELLEAGAIAVYDDVADLFEQLGRSPLAA